MPTIVPITPERQIVGAHSFASFFVMIASRKRSFFPCSSLVSVSFSTINCITWAKPNAPMTRGISWMPDSRLILPNVKRGIPVALSMPIVARIMPNIVEIKPLEGESPSSQLILLKDRIMTATISLGPNINPISASAVPINVKIRMPMVPPKKDATFAVNSAAPGRPFLVSGYPSIAVIIAGESPGIFSRIALNAPPYILP